MIAIKMDMPKSCGNCNFLQISSMSTNNDVSGFCWDLREYISSTNENPKDCRCRLIALPEENKDMSWEELKEKVKKLIPKIEIWGESTEYFDIKIGGLCFWQDGEILNDNDTISTNKTPYQMYQIIKALIGDER